MTNNKKAQQAGKQVRHPYNQPAIFSQFSHTIKIKKKNFAHERLKRERKRKVVA